MFLICFLVFILIFTLFENISIASISLVLVFILLLIYQFLSKKKIVWQKMIVFVCLSFLLAGLSFGVKEWLYYGYSNPLSSSNNLIWTWTISDVSTQGKYIFSYQNVEYLLYSDKEYTIGDQLWIVGNKQENNHTGWFSYRTISPETFNIPLLSGAFDFTTWMKMKWRHWVIYETNSLIIHGGVGISTQQNGFWPQHLTLEWGNAVWWTKEAKKNIQEKIIEYYGKNKVSGLILGMLIGDRSQIPDSEYQSFINSGLVHLVAVSGGNVLMIVIFLQFILFFLPFYVRLGVILLTIIEYGCICGLDSSVFRAVLMGGMSMFALFRWREINIWRLLSISCIIMLIINPYFLAYDTGFLLSYSAIIGIVYFDTLKENKQEKEDKVSITPPVWSLSRKAGHHTIPLKKEDKKLFKLGMKPLYYIYKNYLSPSIWASIGIFPIIIFFMGKINLLGILGNLFVLPIVPFVMIYGFVSVWLYKYIGWGGILWIEKICIQYIYTISDLVAQYGIYLMVSWLRCKYVILLLCVVFFVYRRIKSGEQIEAIKNGKT